MSADTRGIRERLEEIKAREANQGTLTGNLDFQVHSRADVPWLVEQLEEALRKIERLENSIEVRQ